MAKGQKISDEIRSAVMAELLAGHAVTKVAERFNIPHSTVSRLKTEIPQEKLDEVGRKKGDRIAELITQNLELSFTAMNNIANQTNNDEWLSKQNADDLATLFGVTADKVFRVLEAIQNAQEQEWPEEVNV